MDTIQPSEAAILASVGADDETPQEISLTIRLRVTNEDLLRRIAADRMARSGFESDPEIHRDLPLEELAYQAMYGSNPDPLGPDQMGIEIVSNGVG